MDPVWIYANISAHVSHNEIPAILQENKLVLRFSQMEYLVGQLLLMSK